MSIKVEGLYNVFKNARVNAQYEAGHEIECVTMGQQPWGIYNSTLPHYDDVYSTIFNESLVTHLQRVRRTKGSAYALDVMGTGGFTRWANIDGEAAITLVDFRNDKEIEADNKRNAIVIEGDVLSGLAWREARDYLESEQNGKSALGFDLVYSKPVFGWNVLLNRDRASTAGTNSVARLIEVIIVSKMLKLVNPNEGRLFIALSEIHSDYKHWVELLNEVPGIEATGKDSLVGIVKKTDVDLKLPQIPKPIPSVWTDLPLK